MVTTSKAKSLATKSKGTVKKTVAAKKKVTSGVSGGSGKAVANVDKDAASVGSAGSGRSGRSTSSTGSTKGSKGSKGSTKGSKGSKGSKLQQQNCDPIKTEDERRDSRGVDERSHSKTIEKRDDVMMDGSMDVIMEDRSSHSPHSLHSSHGPHTTHSPLLDSTMSSEHATLGNHLAQESTITTSRPSGPSAPLSYGAAGANSAAIAACANGASGAASPETEFSDVTPPPPLISGNVPPKKRGVGSKARKSAKGKQQHQQQLQGHIQEQQQLQEQQLQSQPTNGSKPDSKTPAGKSSGKSSCKPADKDSTTGKQTKGGAGGKSKQKNREQQQQQEQEILFGHKSPEPTENLDQSYNSILCSPSLQAITHTPRGGNRISSSHPEEDIHASLHDSIPTLSNLPSFDIRNDPNHSGEYHPLNEQLMLDGNHYPPSPSALERGVSNTSGASRGSGSGNPSMFFQGLSASNSFGALVASNSFGGGATGVGMNGASADSIMRKKSGSTGNNTGKGGESISKRVAPPSTHAEDEDSEAHHANANDNPNNTNHLTGASPDLNNMMGTITMVNMRQDLSWEILNQDSFGFNLGQGTLSLSFSDNDEPLALPPKEEEGGEGNRDGAPADDNFNSAMEEERDHVRDAPPPPYSEHERNHKSFDKPVDITHAVTESIDSPPTNRNKLVPDHPASTSKYSPSHHNPASRLAGDRRSKSSRGPSSSKHHQGQHRHGQAPPAAISIRNRKSKREEREDRNDYHHQHVSRGSRESKLSERRERREEYSRSRSSSSRRHPHHQHRRSHHESHGKNDATMDPYKTDDKEFDYRSINKAIKDITAYNNNSSHREFRETKSEDCFLDQQRSPRSGRSSRSNRSPRSSSGRSPRASSRSNRSPRHHGTGMELNSSPRSRSHEYPTDIQEFANGIADEFAQDFANTNELNEFANEFASDFVDDAHRHLRKSRRSGRRSGSGSSNERSGVRQSRSDLGHSSSRSSDLRSDGRSSKRSPRHGGGSRYRNQGESPPPLPNIESAPSPRRMESWSPEEKRYKSSSKSGSSGRNNGERIKMEERDRRHHRESRSDRSDRLERPDRPERIESRDPSRSRDRSRDNNPSRDQGRDTKDPREHAPITSNRSHPPPPPQISVVSSGRTSSWPVVGGSSGGATSAGAGGPHRPHARYPNAASPPTHGEHSPGSVAHHQQPGPPPGVPGSGSGSHASHHGSNGSPYFHPTPPSHHMYSSHVPHSTPMSTHSAPPGVSHPSSLQPPNLQPPPPPPPSLGGESGPPPGTVTHPPPVPQVHPAPHPAGHPSAHPQPQTGYHHPPHHSPPSYPYGSHAPPPASHGMPHPHGPPHGAPPTHPPHGPPPGPAGAHPATHPPAPVPSHPTHHHPAPSTNPVDPVHSAFLPPPPPQFTNPSSDNRNRLNGGAPPREVYIVPNKPPSYGHPHSQHPYGNYHHPYPTPPGYGHPGHAHHHRHGTMAHHHPPGMAPLTGLTGTSLLMTPNGPPLTREQAPGIGWPAEEDVLLTEVMSNHKSPIDWDVIAREHNRGRSARECHDRWTRYLKPGSRKGQWREEEDAIVLRVIATSGEHPFTQWADLAPQLPGRSGKQIRDRWVNYLNPAINHLPFSREDDLKLWNGHNELGKRWVEISVKIFNSTRSENHIKNRWYSAAFKKFVANEFGPNAYVDAKSGSGLSDEKVS